MIYTNLPTTNIKVSKTCLGTMSFGAHVSEETAWQVMDKALELGINFFDTAEMYSVPTSAETYGLTEEIIGRWMKDRGVREQIVLATKIAGPSRGMTYVRGGNSHFDKANIKAAIQSSLKRLQTDYIDLYQLHWPDRNVPFFGQRTFVHRDNEYQTPIEETLEALKELQDEGLVRHFGISNETPWGTMEFLRLAREKKLPRMVTVQNNYSLLTRTFDVAMAEVSHREDIGLLAYSPMAYGALSGRYLDGQNPEGGRLTKYPDFVPRYRTPHVEAIIKQYKTLAESHGFTLAQMAHAFVYSRSFLTSCIIGPSNVAQLIEDTEAINIKLSPKILEAIDEIHEEFPNPCA